ncbi:hypothetical protein Ancab_012685 [Ancistrocladus abbreviatus]
MPVILLCRYAQETDAGQLTRSLLLVPRATVNVKPNLQIIADNVKCSHGAAISDLEEDQLFYFQARGIDLEMARKALIFSFGSEVIECIPHAPLQEKTKSRIEELLDPVTLSSRNGVMKLQIDGKLAEDSMGRKHMIGGLGKFRESIDLIQVDLFDCTFGYASTRRQPLYTIEEGYNLPRKDQAASWSRVLVEDNAQVLSMAAFKRLERIDHQRALAGLCPTRRFRILHRRHGGFHVGALRTKAGEPGGGDLLPALRTTVGQRVVETPEKRAAPRMKNLDLSSIFKFISAGE